jgi:hypothetical protein
MVGYLETVHGAILDADEVVEVPASRRPGDVITVELSLNSIRETISISPISIRRNFHVPEYRIPESGPAVADQPD